MTKDFESPWEKTSINSDVPLIFALFEGQEQTTLPAFLQLMMLLPEAWLDHFENNP